MLHKEKAPKPCNKMLEADGRTGAHGSDATGDATGMGLG